LSIEDESCSWWYPGATKERGVLRTAQPAEAGGDTSPPKYNSIIITVILFVPT
jgi:hypothetical protein